MAYQDNAVTLSWDNSGIISPNNWQIEYGINGFTLGTGTIITANNSTFTVTNLSENTIYDFYIKSNCNLNMSINSIKRTVKTRCSISAGYTTSFEDASYSTYPACWRRLSPLNRNYSYSPNYYGFVSGSSHTGSKSILIKTESATGDVDAINKIVIVTPKINDFNNNKVIKFWAYCNNNSSQTPQKVIVGTLSDPDDYTTFTAFETISYPLSSPTQWKQFTVDFSSYNGTDKYIGFKNFQNTNHHILQIDDFEYLENPCNKPSNLLVQQISASSVNLSWNSNIQNATTWEIEYGLSGFTLGSGTIVTTSSNPFTLNNLLNNKNYDFRVRNICSNSNINWSVLYKFKVACQVNAPFEDNFDQYQTNGLDPSLCWSTSSISNSNIIPFSLNNINSPLNSFFLETSSNGNAGIFTSPFLSDFNNNKTIKFWAYLPEYNLNEQPNLIIGTVTNPSDLSSFVPFQTIILDNSNFSGKEFTVDFSNYSGNNKFIVFKSSLVSLNGYLTNKIYIDDFKYYETPSCKEPVNILFQDTTDNSTNVSWNSFPTSQNVKVEYGPIGFSLGTGTITNTSNSTITINGLQNSSQYDFYFTTICANGASLIVGPKKLNTNCQTMSLPWSESFNGLSQYGLNIIPNCYKKESISQHSLKNTSTDISSYSSYFSPDGLLTGVNDTTYLYMNNGFGMGIYSPMFNLIAGTTYKFSLQARKSYEYASATIRLIPIKGQDIYNRRATLFTNGGIYENSYSISDFYYTPFTSGNYSFLMNFQASGGLNMIVDDLNLDEGYGTIVNNYRLYDFNQIVADDFIKEKTINTSINSISDNSQNVLQLKGSTSNFFDAVNIWLNNEDNSTKLNFKFDATSLNSLYLKMNLKQTFESNLNYSSLRVLINGNQVGNIINPLSINDDYSNYEFDLNPFIGTIFNISIQHIGKSINDNALFKTIEFSPVSSLNTTEFTKTNIIAYPNPTSDNFTIVSSLPIKGIEIINVSGQIISKYKIEETESTTLYLANYTDGIYFVNVLSDFGKKTLKISKQSK